MAKTPTNNKPRTVLTLRERRLVRFRAQGHAQGKAGVLAGYASGAAVASVLRRPLVQSALTDALRKQGITLSKIVKPIKDALSANLVTVFMGVAKENKQIPDHKTRLEACDRALALHGGLPKQVELPPMPREPLTVIFESNAQGQTRAAVRLGGAPDPARPQTPAERQDEQLRIVLTGPDAPSRNI